MKYFKQFKEAGAEPFEITKEKAKETLSGYWDEICLRDIFDNNKGFRLYTPFSEVWTEIDNKTPMPGFYGVVE